ncbi:MAG: tyrosine--tRNA ligase [bacterium]|nr:tyrosine--tRNA ligase [bacterium]
MMKEISLNSEIFTRGVEDIVTREELASLLNKKKPLRVKLGIDATASDLHIGHAVNLWKIRAMQEAGHKAVIILGEFTTRIGDPTGKSTTRPRLSPEVIKKNIASLRKQVESILLTSPNVYEVRKNSEWFGKMKLQDFLGLASLVTHARLIERDMFARRIKEGKEITISEMLYPILQGYDSVMIQSDVTIIGSDQLFNEHIGRLFQEKMGQRPQVIMTHKLLPGLSGGEKMSKSLGNYIGLTDSPKDKFGKAMRILDSLIIPYFEVYTNVPMAEIDHIKEDLEAGKNPMEAKMMFAEALVARYHGARVASQEKKEFQKVFSQGNIPDAIPEISLHHGSWSTIELLIACNLAPSKSEARRLLGQGAVEINGSTIEEIHKEVIIKKGSVVRVGKRRFVKIA